ncbi:MAG: regulatory protein RecX [Gammaproteobacteria bacterium]|nr:regulatory protein RecX [Gammaproteobacteria bacterium]
MAPTLTQALEIEAAAVRLLAAREHSRAELARKLAARFAPEALAAVLDDLSQRGLQSDQRFAEQYLRMRANRGYGPLAIRHELQQRGISADLVSQVMDALDLDWAEQLRQVHERKFGAELPQDYKESGRRGRFLAQRGFSADLIHSLLKGH